MRENKANKFGLKRSSLTSGQKRQIRQNAGFGCVICGKAIGQYEHIDPPFSEAKEHDPSKMTYLCASHHEEVTRGHRSKESIAKAALDPIAKKAGFSFGAFDVGSDSPTITIGPVVVKSCKSIITVLGKEVLAIHDPEEPGTPFRLNAEMRDAAGKVIFSIQDNEWKIRNGNWDAEIVGPQIVIRESPGSIALKIRTDPPSSLFVEQMNMSYRGHSIECDAQKFEIVAPSGRRILVGGAQMTGCEGAVVIDSNSIILGVGGGSVMLMNAAIDYVHKPPLRSIRRRRLELWLRSTTAIVGIPASILNALISPQ
ncbi:MULTISPECIES: HNH endonuclease [unclassified Rhizobium]|uniref:HNH endonuclease signature motif containing protein n=1 Tax=unclassified Rhizobium TaxID=2613769 RepID=UPI0016209A04|nr:MULTISPECIES: HNH endonuclease [unclassified Rhizobium]MBB3385799.1 hypothetical protein [Rhizobium sp. BK098]MBB3617504.1 hypothetical protein [Rhizobium sp. BK609]MBB3683233.1 hypothetical protein [Rhizobium sp. BK612]